MSHHVDEVTCARESEGEADEYHISTLMHFSFAEKSKVSTCPCVRKSRQRAHISRRQRDAVCAFSLFLRGLAPCRHFYRTLFRLSRIGMEREVGGRLHRATVSQTMDGRWDTDNYRTNTGLFFLSVAIFVCMIVKKLQGAPSRESIP